MRLSQTAKKADLRDSSCKVEGEEERTDREGDAPIESLFESLGVLHLTQLFVFEDEEDHLGG